MLERMKWNARRRHPPAGLVIAAVVLASLRADPLLAADPQPYTVSIAKTPNSSLNAALAGSSELEKLRTTAPAGPFALIARARADQGRFVSALQSFGYYKGTIAITIDGHPLDDLALPQILAAAPAKPPARVEVAVAAGPQFHITTISLAGAYPPGLGSALAIHPGAPAVAGDVVAGQAALLTRLRNTGYALAKVHLEPATLVLPTDAMEVTYRVESGPRVDIGAISFEGLDGVSESYARRALPLHQGELFDESKIADARDELAKTPIFASVLVVPATGLNAAGQIPLVVQTTERKRHAVDFGASYSTDIGLGLNAGWHDRNLFGNAEQLNLTAAGQFGGNSQLAPGYRVNAQFIKPAFLRRDQELQANLGAVDQTLIPYKQVALLQSLVITRRLSKFWSVSYGLSGEEEDVTQEHISRRYNLIGVPLTIHYDSTDNLLNPTHGVRANLAVTPTQSVTAPTSTYASVVLSGSTYIPIVGKDRTVLALRGLVGDIFGSSQFSLPPDQRFYAGGSSTVRGYKYQTVGPQFPDGTPAGGTEITAATVEVRQRIGKSFGVSVFTDAAQVSAPGANLSGKYAIGTGVGAEYYTSFGPIRAEVAVPLVKFPNSGSFEVYVGLGQAF